MDYLNDQGKLVNFVEDGSCGVIRFKSVSSKEVIIPGKELIETSDYPFTAHGFTSGKRGRLGTPEWKFEADMYAKPQDGAELWEVYSNGDEKLIAVYEEKLGKFIKK